MKSPLNTLQGRLLPFGHREVAVKITCGGRAVLTLVIVLLAGFGWRVQGASHPWIKSYEGSQSCTRCHVDAAREIMATSHWTWEHTDPKSGQKLGKRHVINNYCVALPSNEPRCTSCHVGVGYADKTFDFNDSTKVDCLVCHDTTGDYKKFPAGSGHPVTGEAKEFPGGSGVMWQPVDLVKVAQNVGRTSRMTCGACHFFGGGGDAVKHGDIDSSLYQPTREVDVHMGAGGGGFQCADCHQPVAHKIPGTRYPKAYTDNQMCESCHTGAPHATTNPTLDLHTARVACQTCHIPAFARGDKATKMFWDWSTAGRKDANGKNMVIRNAAGEVTYDTQKGDFIWERDVVPEYVWFNGDSTYATLDDRIEPGEVMFINRLKGDGGDPSARIFPVKRFVGVQPYDAASGTLVIPHLFPRGAADADAYWKSYDWNRAIKAGMDYVDRPYSGNLGWVRTEMFWVQNHMVAPKEQALACNNCHVPRGRLDFAALGYSADRATRLQTLAGFEIGGVEALPHGSGFRLKWLGTPGHVYEVQVSQDLATWTTPANGVLETGDSTAELVWAGSESAGDTPRFYRIMRRVK